MLNRTLIGQAVALALMAPADVVISGAGAAVDGTVISTNLQKMAHKAIKAVWDVTARVQNASAMVLELAKAAVTESDGDEKLALAKFEAAMSSAALDLRTANKEATGEERERLEDFLDPKGTWSQYLSNFRRYIKTFPPEQLETFKSETALRKAAQSIKEATRTRTSLKDKMGAELDLSEVTDDEFSACMRKATGEDGKVNETTLKKALIAAGADERDDEESDEDRATRIRTQAMEASETFFGDGEHWKVCRESLAKLLVLIAEIPDDAGHENELNQALNNAFVKIAQTFKRGQAVAPKGAQDQPRVQTL